MTLNLDSFDENSKKRSTTKYKAALGVGSVVSLFGIGSTLAANISLNGGGNVEFGQGVATTAACDEDGIRITPVTSYDNEHSIFRVDYVQVEGLNLTPEGSLNNTLESYSDLGIVDKNADSVVDQEDAKLQYPGQYYDDGDWKRTCDNVVLDFKAYTDEAGYLNKTIYGYGNTSPNQLNPIGWKYYGEDSNWDPGFATIVDVNNNADGWESNYAVNSVTGSFSSQLMGEPADMFWEAVDYSDVSNVSFKFWVTDDNFKQDAGAISKITVQSSKEFPPDYYSASDNLGNPDLIWTYS